MNTKALTVALVLGAAAPTAVLAHDDAKMHEESAMEETGQYISDSAMTAEVKSALIAEDGSMAMNVDVETTDGVVSLNGTVASEEEAKLAEKVAEEVDGVKDVDNRLEVATRAK